MVVNKHCELTELRTVVEQVLDGREGSMAAADCQCDVAQGGKLGRSVFFSNPCLQSVENEEEDISS